MSFELDKLRLGSLFGHFQDSGPWFGLGQEQHWDPVLAVFLADRISYPVWEDQASFECVQSLLQVYSEGFEVGFFFWFGWTVFTLWLYGVLPYSSDFF